MNKGKDHIPKFIEDDDEAPATPSDAALTRLHEATHRQLELEEEIAQVEQLLKDLKSDLRKVSEKDLPAIMDELGIDSMVVHGYKVAVGSQLTMSIPKSNLEWCAEWLEQNGLGTLVKKNVSVEFARGDDSVSELTEMLENSGFTYKEASNVVTQSVKAALRQMLAEGQNVPLEEFGGLEVRKSTIKKVR